MLQRLKIRCRLYSKKEQSASPNPGDAGLRPLRIVVRESENEEEKHDGDDEDEETLSGGRLRLTPKMDLRERLGFGARAVTVGGK
ncbi:hypothetical protein ACHAQJ_001091 [Trichoderma viride]